MKFFFVLLALHLARADDPDRFLALLNQNSFAQPTCALALQKEPGFLGRYARGRFRKQIEATELNWLWASELDRKFSSTRQWARYGAASDRFARLYLHVLRLNEDLPGLKRWLSGHLHSADVVLDTAPQHESYQGGLDQKSTQHRSRVAAYLSHPTLAATIEHNGLMVVTTSRFVIENGIIHGERYGGEMGDTEFYIVKGKKIAEALPVIRDAFTHGDYTAVTLAIRMGKIVSQTSLRQGRAVMRYGPAAGEIVYVDTEILNWGKDGIHSSCVYGASGKPVVLGCVYPFVQVRHFTASRWVRALRGL